MRSTHTYVVMELSPAAHAEIKAKMLAAGYQHAIDGDTIDMHGIAVEPKKKIFSRREQLVAVVIAAPLSLMAAYILLHLTKIPLW
jgi:hypothetical protein